MAEFDEQPTLLSDDTEKVKKPKRTRSVTAAKTTKKPVAKKTGVKRTKKPAPVAEVAANEANGQAVAVNETESLPLEAPGRETPERPSEGREAPGRPGDGKLGSRGSRRTEAPLFEPAEPARTGEVRVWSPERSPRTSPAPAAEAEPAEPAPVKDRDDSAVVVEAPRPEPVYGEGLIEVSGKGFGFLRDPKRNYMQSPQDIFVTPEVVRKHALRDGLWIKGEIRRGSRGPQLFKLVSINNEDPDKYRNLPVFEELTSINPIERIRLETVPDRYTTRVMDLMTPIGKGQRGLIVAPPRTGKTTLLQHIADAVCKNHPEMNLIILLVDERPEEVTEIRRTVPKADIMASSNDSDLKSHTRIAQLAIERAKRLVEAGKDVFVLMDSLTRIGRAFNNAISGSGRTMSGGMDSRAMEIPRKLFAAARNTEEAGSLTIMATALIETGSKMDELIFQEFKGTGNMEMVLDRQISDQRTYPAIDIFKSGTRREELLLPAHQLDKINMIRRGLAGHRPAEAIERLLSFLRKFPTNAQMLREIPG
ncbi:MAG: transcription termination factor Rho [Verrucomicrobia bacterium]|nr:transcription termination factor Rho [Verrucomicrobiota bacterium]